MFPHRIRCVSILFLIFLFCSVPQVYSQTTEIVSDNINQVVCRLVYLIEVTIGAIAALFIVVFGLQKIDFSKEGSKDTVYRKIAHVFIGLIIVIISMPIVNIVIAGLLPGIECRISDIVADGSESPDPPGGDDVTVPDNRRKDTDDPSDGESIQNTLPKAVAFVGLDQDPKEVRVKASVDEIVYFSGKDSSDDDGVIISYSWDFGDGEPVTGMELISIEHSYGRPKTYAVSLIVTDDLEGADECIVYVDVEEDAPVERVDPDEGETDPDGDATTPDGDRPDGDNDPVDENPDDEENPSSVGGSSRPLGGDAEDTGEDSTPEGDDSSSSVAGGSRPLTGSGEETALTGGMTP